MQESCEENVNNHNLLLRSLAKLQQENDANSAVQYSINVDFLAAVIHASLYPDCQRVFSFFFCLYANAARKARKKQRADYTEKEKQKTSGTQDRLGGI